jgi:hypothetical protein
MPRPPALIAILLAVTWCSAAWHVQLEAAGVLFEHEHRAHHHHADADNHHAPTGADDGHDPVFARQVVKDQMHTGPAPGLWIGLLGLAVWLMAACPRRAAVLRVTQRPTEMGPPLARVWQFLQRCAPRSAAPPALG